MFPPSEKQSAISVGHFFNVPPGSRSVRKKNTVSIICSRGMHVTAGLLKISSHGKFCNKSAYLFCQENNIEYFMPTAGHYGFWWWPWCSVWGKLRGEKCHPMNSCSFLPQSAFVSVSLGEYMCRSVLYVLCVSLWLGYAILIRFEIRFEILFFSVILVFRYLICVCICACVQLFLSVWTLAVKPDLSLLNNWAVSYCTGWIMTAVNPFTAKDHWLTIDPQHNEVCLGLHACVCVC